MHVDVQRLATGLEHPVGDVQEARTARAAKELAAGRGEQVAADLLDVDGVLADRLAGVDQVQQVEFAAVPADLGDRLDQPGVGGYVRHGHQARSVGAHQRGHGVDVDAAAVGVVGGVHDPDAVSLAQGEEGDLVGDEVVAGGEDDVVRAEVDGREGFGVGVGRARREGDVAGAGAQEFGERGVEVGDLAGPGGGGLVAADGRFQPQVVEHRLEHRTGHQAAAGVVEVDHLLAPGGVGSQGGEIEERFRGTGESAIVVLHV